MASGSGSEAAALITAYQGLYVLILTFLSKCVLMGFGVIGSMTIAAYSLGQVTNPHLGLAPDG